MLTRERTIQFVSTAFVRDCSLRKVFKFVASFHLVCTELNVRQKTNDIFLRCEIHVCTCHFFLCLVLSSKGMFIATISFTILRDDQLGDLRGDKKCTSNPLS